MKTISTLLLSGMLLGLGGCSTSTGQDLGQRFEQSSLGQAIHSPEAEDAKRKLAKAADDAKYHSGLALQAAERKLQIAKFPTMQPVIVRNGSHLAQNKQEAMRTANSWNHQQQQNYAIELADGQIFFLEQVGPQFYQDQMATLIRHGLSVTLVP